MATRDSTNDALAAQRAIIKHLFDEIKERDEQAYAMVSAIKSWLPNDLNPANKGLTSTTEHLLNVLDEMLTCHILFNSMEKQIAALGEVHHA